VGRCSSVGIATELRAGRSGSRWGARFSTPVQTGTGAHPASCTMGTGFFPGCKERPGRDADPSPLCSAVGHERVELYLYSPYGPYGLYRASVPVQGCTLPLPLFSVPLQTGPGAHPVSCTMGTGSFPGVKSGRGVTLTPQPLLVPLVMKE